MNINPPQLASFLITGMLWTAMSVCVLWLCQQVVSAAATKLLGPVLWVLALCNALEIYLWIQNFRTDASHTLVYWIQIALRVLMICLVIPKLRHSMWITALIILPSFVAFVTPHWLHALK